MHDAKNIRILKAEDKTIYFFAIVCFLIWPIGVLLWIILTNPYPKIRPALILFTALFGVTMVADNAGLDLYRVLRSLEEYSNLSSRGNIFSSVSNLYSNSYNSDADIYKDLITFIVSRFTDNGRYLLLIFGAIYGLVFVKSIDIFFQNVNNRNFVFILILVCFSFTVGLDQLAGVRFATASYVFFYGTANFLIKPNWKFLLVALITPLIHFSFFLVVIGLLLYLILRKFNILIYVLLVSSFIVPQIFSGILTQYSNVLGAAVDERIIMYQNQQEIFGQDDAMLAWYVQYREETMMWFAFAGLLLTRFYANKIRVSKTAWNFFYFILIVLSLVNYSMDVPHLGYRFQFVLLMFVLLYMLLVYQENYSNKFIRGFMLFALPAFALQIFYGLRSILYYSPPFLYIGNIFIIFKDEPVKSVWTSIFN